MVPASPVDSDAGRLGNRDVLGIGERSLFQLFWHAIRNVHEETR